MPIVPTPPNAADVPSRLVRSLSRLLNLIADGTATTRAELTAETELARSTVTSRVDHLLDAGMLQEERRTQPGAGRPPLVLSINDRVGLLLCADIGANHTRAAVCTLQGEIVAWRRFGDSGSRQPATLEQTDTAFTQMLGELGRSAADVLGVGVTVASPVNTDTGEILRPPYFTRWNASKLRDFLAQHHDCPALIENDVNAMALGEARIRGLAAAQLMFVKLGTGIGCGVVDRGELQRGAAWCAGDIGHTRLTGQQTRCRCGATGCLESVAGGWALVDQARDMGLSVASTDELVVSALAADPVARGVVRAAGRHIGDVLAGLVSYANPSHLVIGGELARLEDDLLAEIRGVIYQRAVPLATRTLSIEPSTGGERAGVTGVARLLQRYLFSPAGLGGLLRTRASSG